MPRHLQRPRVSSSGARGRRLESCERNREADLCFASLPSPGLVRVGVEAHRQSRVTPGPPARMSHQETVAEARPARHARAGIRPRCQDHAFARHSLVRAMRRAFSTPHPTGVHVSVPIRYRNPAENPDDYRNHPVIVVPRMVLICRDKRASRESSTRSCHAEGRGFESLHPLFTQSPCKSAISAPPDPPRGRSVSRADGRGFRVRYPLPGFPRKCGTSQPFTRGTVPAVKAVSSAGTDSVQKLARSGAAEAPAEQLVGRVEVSSHQRRCRPRTQPRRPSERRS
jgi:hypothetical protein